MSALSTNFSIELQHLEADEEMPARDTVVIDAMETPEQSCGFIVLDHPSDLYKLRAAIDGFIKHHNIQPLNTCAMENEKPIEEQPQTSAAVIIPVYGPVCND